MMQRPPTISRQRWWQYSRRTRKEIARWWVNHLAWQRGVAERFRKHLGNQRVFKA